ncbi:DUF58 domain-containing protein [Candidatus Woesearchaeota archaeon]|nr:DUF58 domain-containing protein [Candidatus Woesearchaeota archaeon]
MQETKEIIRQVRKIEISTKHLVDGIIAGNYHSVFKGNGIEFSDIRDYRPGDDIRSIDWKVTARFNHPFIKEFIEERDLRVYFIFDCSGSGSFGSRVEKKRKAIEMTATLAFSAIRNNDNAGLFIFTDSVEKFIPARKGRKHALKLISSLVSHEARSAKTDIGRALAYVSNVVKKRSVMFIISDFYSDNFIRPLKILKNRHDVIAIKVRDEREKDIPDVGLIELEDEETGEQVLVDTSDEGFRKSYKKLMEDEGIRISSGFRKHKIDCVEISTEGPYERPLKRFFKIRQKRVIA